MKLPTAEEDDFGSEEGFQEDTWADSGWGDEAVAAEDLNPYYDASQLTTVRIKEDMIFDKVRSRLYYDIQSIELIIPADISDELSEEIRNLAVEAFLAIDCAGMARADFLLDRDSNKLYINELNTIPGFTRISMYPKLWDASGLSYAELLDRLIELAIERHQIKNELTTRFDVGS